MGLSQQLAETYRGKRVFVTGHTGFKGSWLMAILAQWGATLRGFALAPEARALYQDLQIEALGHSQFDDLLDGDKLEKAILEYKPDFIFHLAAQPLVLDSYQRPLYTFRVNSEGTAKVLEALRKLNQPCATVCITTDKVYDNQEHGQPFREEEALGGKDPYSASKACAELVVASYRHSFFLNQPDKGIATARAGNVIGGGDWAEYRIIPDMVRAFEKGQSVELRRPEAVRPWQHVLEPLVGYLELGMHLAKKTDPKVYGTAWNFGPEEADTLTVEAVVKKAIEAWGGGSYHVNRPDDLPHEAQLLRLDIAKAKEHLAWQPRWNATQAIAKSIEWYKNALTSPASVQDFTKQQIDEYLHSI